MKKIKIIIISLSIIYYPIWLIIWGTKSFNSYLIRMDIFTIGAFILLLINILYLLYDNNRYNRILTFSIFFILNFIVYSLFILFGNKG